jgi:hypothetical protein
MGGACGTREKDYFFVQESGVRDLGEGLKVILKWL